ncbi:MAG: hypothetical protein ACYTFZ_08040 [Planctomycetota bacterium]|jgi:hypothetical protein
MSARHGRRDGSGRGCIIAATLLVVLIGLVIVAVHLFQRHWEHEVEAKLAEFRAAGQPVTWEEVVAARQPIPDEENSALILLEAFPRLERARGAFAESLVCGFGCDPTSGARHSERVRWLVGEYLESNAEALKLIHEAARLPHGAYPLDPLANPVELPQDHLSEVREAVRLCGAEAAFHAERQDVDRMVRSLLAGRAVVASLGECATLIEALDRIAGGAMWQAGLERCLEVCEMSADHLHALRKLAELEDEELSLELAFCGERSMGHFVFTEAMVHQLGDTDEVSRMLRLVGFIPGWTEMDSLFYYGFLDRAIRISTMPLRERLKQARLWDDQLEAKLGQRQVRHFISMMLTPAVMRAVEEEVNAHVRMRVARAALAVEEWRLEHGQWPESLEQLVPELLGAVPEDPFSDGKVKYARRPDGVVIYSVGRDGQDNGGISVAEAAEKAGYGGQEEWDIPFRLLDPELRGARTLTFREEVLAAGFDYEYLQEAGHTPENLEELGFTPEDFDLGAEWDVRMPLPAAGGQ